MRWSASIRNLVAQLSNRPPMYDPQIGAEPGTALACLLLEVKGLAHVGCCVEVEVTAMK